MYIPIAGSLAHMKENINSIFRARRAHMNRLLDIPNEHFKGSANETRDV